MINRWLLTQAIRLPKFKGKHRMVSLVRSFTVAPFNCDVSHELAMELDCFEWTQLSLAENGTAEPITMALLEQLLEPGDTFIDVGAHVGYVSLVARRLVGSAGKIVAIEPQPYNCERILKNWEINGFDNLSLHVAAAGDRHGFVRLPQQSRTDKARLSLVTHMPDALSLEYEVPLTTLDTVVESNALSSISVLKIDVEGFEASVLRGMTKHLGLVRHIVFEALNDSSTAVKQTHIVRDWLHDRGFRIRTVEGAPWNGEFPIPENNLWASKTSPTL